MIIEKPKCHCAEVIVTLVTTFLYVLALGPLNLWWLLWIAPLLLLLYSFYVKKWKVFLVAALSNIFAGVLVVIAYYGGTLMPLLPLIPMVVISSLFLAGIIVLNSIIVTKWKNWLAILFFPAVMVTFNFLMVVHAKSNLFPVDYAFTQYHFLTLIQLVSLTGIWGVCFLLNFVPNAIAGCIFYRHDKKIYLPVVAVTIMLFLGVLVFGGYKLSHQPQTAKVTIGIAARNYPEPNSISFPQQINADLRNPKAAVAAYVDNIKVLAKQGAQYILQPEYGLFVPINSKIKQNAINAVQQAAAQNHVTVVFPLGEYDETKHEIIANHALLISPQGKIIADYHKRHLVKFSENKIQPKASLTQFLSQSHKMGIAICHDMDYINPAREYGKNAITLLFVPALDFGVAKDAWWHARIAIVQAIANGYSLARVGGYGYLTITDSNGRMIASKATQQNEPVYLVEKVSLGTGNTFYAKYGDWFAWLNIILVLLIILVARVVNLIRK